MSSEASNQSELAALPTQTLASSQAGANPEAALRAEIATLRAENAALQRQLHYQQSLLAAMPDMMFINEGPEGRFIAFHTATRELLAVAPEQFLGRTVVEVFPPELAQTIVGAVRRALTAQSIEVVEYTLPRGEELRNYEARLTARGDEQVVAVVRDITAHKRAEAALRESEERFRLAFDNAGLGMALVQFEGKVLRVNSALSTMLGYSEAELLTKDYQSLTHPDDLAGDYAAAEQLATGERSIIYREKRVIRKDGAIVPILLTASLVFHGDGRPNYFISHLQDFTERKRVEEERLQLERKLQAAQRLESLGVLAGGIAHDFNNLLVGVRGYAELALDELPSQSNAHANIVQAIASAQRAAELTGQLLAYSGRGSFVVQAVDLNTLVREMTDLVRVSTRGHTTLHYHLAESLPRIRADAAQLRQVALNILMNAAEAIEATGAISVSTAAIELNEAELAELHFASTPRPGIYVRLTIQDTGNGMDAATLDRIFDPFFSTKFTGRGLGLAAVQGIVRSHGGALGVQSVPGLGTTFQVYLPADKASPTAAAQTVAHGAQLTLRATGTILVVDDEPSVRALVRRFLERLGFVVLCAANGAAAIELVRTGIADLQLVLMDVTMPELGGLETAAAIRSLRQNLPIVLMSGYTEDALAAQQTDGIVDSFIQKPFGVDQLAQVIQQLLLT